MRLYVRTDRIPGSEGCQFIEVEDEDGVSHFNDVGLRWHDDREGGALLGPFLSPVEPGEDLRQVSYTRTKLYGIWRLSVQPSPLLFRVDYLRALGPPIFRWRSAQPYADVHVLHSAVSGAQGDTLLAAGGREVPVPEWATLEPGTYITGEVPPEQGREVGFSFQVGTVDPLRSLRTQPGIEWTFTPAAMAVDEHYAVIPKLCAGVRLTCLGNAGMDPHPDPGVHWWTLTLLLTSGAEVAVRSWQDTEEQAVTEYERILDRIREAHA